VADHPGFVYYVQIGRYVKIGYSMDWRSRIASYPPDSVLLAVEVGGRDLESIRHDQFSRDLDARREWFRSSTAIREHCLSLRGISQSIAGSTLGLLSEGAPRSARTMELRRERAASGDWLTLPEVAGELVVSIKTVRRMITRGDLTAKRFGPRLIRVARDSVTQAGRALQYTDPKDTTWQS